MQEETRNQRCRARKKMRITSQLATLRILAVVPDQSVVNYTLDDSYSLGRCFYDYTTLENGRHSQDFVLPLVGGSPRTLFEWEKDDDTGMHSCTLQGCYAAWAFTLGCLLVSDQQAIVDADFQRMRRDSIYDEGNRPNVSFTAASSFKEAAKQNKASEIGDNIDLVLITDPVQMFNDHADAMTTEDFLQWCAQNMERNNKVQFYPSLEMIMLSVMKEKRNRIFKGLRLPTVEVQFQGSWDKVMASVVEKFNQEGHTVDREVGFVAKPPIGSCGDGIIKLQWNPSSNSTKVTKLVPDSNAEEMEGQHIMYSVEPFVSNLKEEEFRLFYRTSAYGTKCRGQAMHMCQTKLEENGDMACEEPKAEETFLKTLPPYERQSVQELVEDVLAAMASEFNSIHLANMVFRLDIFFVTKENNKKAAFLNEVEVFPSAEPFLTRGRAHTQELISLCIPACVWIRNHLDFWSPPAT
jgi:hypothetical protein